MIDIYIQFSAFLLGCYKLSCTKANELRRTKFKAVETQEARKL